MTNGFRPRGLAFFALFLSLPLAAFSQPLVWTTSSLVRTGVADPAGSGTQAVLSAARGEYESFQIAIQAPYGGLNNVNASVSDLTGPGGAVIAQSNISLFREQYVYVSQSSPNWGGSNQPLGAGWYPDALIPFNDPNTGQPIRGAQIEAVPFDLGGAQNQPLWVDVFVPRDAVPGQYTGTFTVTSNQGTASGSIVLTVWNFTLPLQPSLKSAFLFYAGQSTAADKELLRNRISPLHTDPAAQSDLINNYGLNVVGLAYYSGAAFDHCSMSDPPSVADLSALAAQQQPSLEKIDYSADETYYCSSLVPQLQAWGRNLHAAGVKNLVTASPITSLFDDGTGSGISTVDIWAMLPIGYDASPALNAQALARGNELWSYNALVQDDYSPKWLIDFAPINYRIQPGFISQSLNLTGLLYWKVDNWSDDPWNQVNNFPSYSPNNYPGDGMLVYPGYQVGIDGVAPSMRLKWIRDGIEDYEYVQILKLAGRASDALGLAASVGPDWRNWTRDIDKLLSVRAQIGQEIDSLNGGSAAPASDSASSASPAPAATASGTVAISAVLPAAAGANASPGVLTPGSFVSIYGANLAGNGDGSASTLPLPTTLNGAQAFLNSTPMHLIYAGPNQINALVPREAAAGASYTLTVVNNGFSSAVPVSVATIRPAIFSTDSSGSGQGDIYIAGTTVLASASGNNARPAHAGEYVTLYCDALGPVQGQDGESAPADGSAAPAGLYTMNQITISFGGAHEPVQFAGLAPFLAGVYQVNAQIPSGLSGDAVPVTLTMTDPQTGQVVQSNTVTVAVQ
ncbi:MAG TPA: glycoside hydrolase domain-containing protein [Bryobacteraceae bacterium]|nr:glycoside hydrolase domain-containing protein [Bryobacteraceae bacterium]